MWKCRKVEASGKYAQADPQYPRHTAAAALTEKTGRPHQPAAHDGLRVLLDAAGELV